MKVSVTGINTQLSKKETRFAVEFFLERIMSKRIVKNMKVNIFNRPEMGRYAGFCSPTDFDELRPREFDVTLNSEIDRELQLEALAHEMVHVRQFATGQLVSVHGPLYRWKGQKVYAPKKDSNDIKKQIDTRPWEAEAYALDGELKDLYFYYEKYRELQ